MAISYIYVYIVYIKERERKEIMIEYDMVEAHEVLRIIKEGYTNNGENTDDLIECECFDEPASGCDKCEPDVEEIKTDSDDDQSKLDWQYGSDRV